MNKLLLDELVICSDLLFYRATLCGIIRYYHYIFVARRKGEKKMQKIQNIQDTMLNQIRREKQTATFFLMNGFQLKGIVKSFDSFVVIVESEGRQQMIYKHAISTIIPAQPIELYESHQSFESQL